MVPNDFPIRYFRILLVAAIGFGSNRITIEQPNKPTRVAHQLANNRILVIPACDEECETGLKDLPRKLTAAGIQVRLS